jgi:hypothetical protein
MEVALMVPCYIDVFYPQVGIATLEFLERLGVAKMAETVVPEAIPDLDDFVRSRFPNTKVICSTVPECKGTMRSAELSLWSEASRIGDRSRFLSGDVEPRMASQSST